MLGALVLNGVGGEVDGVDVVTVDQSGPRQGAVQLHKQLTMLGTELSLSSRGRMTLGVREIFWFISHTLPQCHALQGVGDTYLQAASQPRIC
jgi:hypothetical protein